MTIRKKTAPAVLAVVLALSLAACGGNGQQQETVSESGSDSISALSAESCVSEPKELKPDVSDNTDDPAAAACGSWYGLYRELPYTMEIQEDGSYVLTMSWDPENPHTGTWSWDSGIVRLEDFENSWLELQSEDALYWPDMETVLVREELAVYVPADTVAADSPEAFAGYWRNTYMVIDGVMVTADFLEDDTDVFIDGGKIVLGGPFGDIVRDFTFADGAITLTEQMEDAVLDITLQLQEDGGLRMTLDAEEDTAVLYLFPDEEYAAGAK